MYETDPQCLQIAAQLCVARFGGFDIDLARAMARELGVDFAPVNTRWTSIIPSLTLGRCDIIISGMSVTEQRRRTRWFCARPLPPRARAQLKWAF